MRRSLAFASWKESREVAAALKPIYRAPNAEHARQQLDEFAAGYWGRRYPAIAPAWQRQWEKVVPFFPYSKEVPKNHLPNKGNGSPHSQLRKAVRARGHFPSDEAASKL